MMRSYLSLAWKELKAQRVTAVLILAAIFMSTILTTVIGQSMGILRSMRVQQAAGLNGNRFATFLQLTEKQAKMLHADKRLYDVGDILYLGKAALGNSNLALYLREYRGHTLEMYPAIGTVREGRLPKKANEIALSEDTLKYLGLDISVGDTLSLDLSAGLMDGSIPSYDYSAKFTLTGILENCYLGYATGSIQGVAGEGAAQKLLPQGYLYYSTDFKTHSKAKFQEIIYDLADKLDIDEGSIQYNWVLLDAMGIAYDNAEGSDTDTGFSFMTAASVLVGILVLLAAGLVIYNVLKISVAKRIRVYGTLRAIGGRRGQIYRLVFLQLLILCGIGIPAGLLSGFLSAKGILAAVVGVLNPQLFLADSTEELSAAIHTAGATNLKYLLLSVGVTLLFAMLASFPAARYASHVSPTVAMSGKTLKIKRRIKKNKKISSFEAYYARLNLKRGRGRTVVTVLSLVMSITVYIALQSFTTLLDASSGVQDLYFGDYAVTNETTGISAEAVHALQRYESVESLSTSKLSVFMPGEGDSLPFETDLSVQPHETLQIASVDEKRFFSYVTGLTEQDRQDLAEGTACLVKNPIAFSYDDVKIQQTQLEIGDTISLGGSQMRIAGIVNTPVMINNQGYTNGVQLIVNDDMYHTLTGSDRYSEIYPTLKPGADAGAFEKWLEAWRADVPGTHWLSYRQSDAQMAESFAQIKMLCWALIAFVGIIGILNIINTVYSNIHTRIAEIGMQRAVGMSAISLYKTFLWEGAYYGILATVIGAILGYISAVFVGAASTDTLEFVPIPFLTIGEAAIISIGACLLATVIPLGSIARMDIVESIDSQE